MNTLFHALEKELATFPPEICVRNADWKNISTLGIGGLIELMLEPRTVDQLSQILIICRKLTLRPVILGGGSNVVGTANSDKSFIVIRLARGEFLDFSIDPHTQEVHVGAGLRLRRFAEKAAGTGFGGLSELAGIPGTVGGALIMNAGAHEKSISDHLSAIEGLTPNGEFIVIPAETLTFSYRHGGIPEGVIITGARFDLPQSETDDEADETKKFLQYRLLHEPKGRTAGCVFRNPLNGHLSAGKLIEAAGLKGFQIGDAIVSTLHANYFLNSDNAVESDYTELVLAVQRHIYQHTGLVLRSEIRWINEENQNMIDHALPTLSVAVLKGGNSSEREISLRSGGGVAEALREAGFKVYEIDLQQCEITPEMREADIVFPVLHGGFGENGDIQALMEAENIPFVGCPSATCRLVMDKVDTKSCLDKKRIPNAAWKVLHKTDPCRKIPEGMSLPLVVKPPTEGSSIGVTIVKLEKEWDGALALAFRYADTALIETFVKGKEVAVSVIDGVALPLVELQFKGEFYDYDAKYTYKNGTTEYLCPPPDIPEAVQQLAQAYAVEFSEACGVRDLIRVDFIITDDGIPYVIEGNSTPGMTATSLVPKAAKVMGLSFPELCARLVVTAARRAGLIKEPAR